MLEQTVAYPLSNALLLDVVARLPITSFKRASHHESEDAADRQDGASFLRDEELALNRYLPAGDSRQLNAIGETQRELRQRAGRVRALNSLVDLEDSWYVNYAEPLIHARQQFDAGTGTIAHAEQQQNRSQIMARESANKSNAEELRNDYRSRGQRAGDAWGSHCHHGFVEVLSRSHVCRAHAAMLPMGHSL